MSMVKVIEVLAESEKGWEDATQQALKEASQTVRNIKSVYVKDFQLALENGKQTYRVNAKISFLVDGEARGRKHGGAEAAGRR
jgi:flavin-binding protein dodecin